ncbi:hypothetical protein TSH7_25055 [Azospirillum sp. TSH7]|uniref:hypothetical protein n=1 Tax=unclassified Azospirillum TaxID=2630922 RepID=UPI000D605DEB|nr:MULTISPECIES: hypothetical protein [unclassified Azospirillum]PWC57817.1 hypothetical protein TSH7_25055 [Azospirillum sp. TSH7]PWC70236.1 hypothetical protein TSH20_07095 [Azospirillum sp. TSH20]
MTAAKTHKIDQRFRWYRSSDDGDAHACVQVKRDSGKWEEAFTCHLSVIGLLKEIGVRQAIREQPELFRPAARVA